MRSDHLLLRGATYHYRRRVPLPLIERAGKREITFSLKTSDLKEARKKRDLEDVKFNALFEKWTVTEVSDCPGNKQINTAELVHLVQEYVQRHDLKAKCRELTDPELLDEGRQQELDQERAMLNNDENPNVLQWIYNSGFDALGFPSSELSPEGSLLPFLEIMRRGLAELCDRKLHRSAGDFSKPYVSDLFAPQASMGYSFEDAAKEYLVEVSEGARANGSSQKWVDKQKANIALLVEIIGPSTPLRDVDYDQCSRVRSVLGAIPANRSKLFAGLDLEEAIKLGEAEQKSKLAPVTQDQYLATLRAILSLAMRKRKIPVNPAEDMGPLQRETVRAKDRRKPWTETQLSGFFASQFYRQCAEPRALALRWR